MALRHALKLNIAFAIVILAALTPAHAQTWTGTWAVSPQSGGGTFSQQTIRQIVYTSISGTAARIRLSNIYGSSAITVSDVHIALAGSGSSTQAGTDHTVTFGGSTTVTINAGADVNSDSIAMNVPALTELAISFYLPNSTNIQTYHQLSNQTIYVANGDVSGSTSISVASQPQSYYVLTNLDVQNSAATGSVAAVGASITDGYASTFNANHRWPNDLAQRMASAGITVGVLNQGISGNQLLTDGAGPSAEHRFAHDAIGQPNVKWVIFSDDPINDVGNNSSITGSQLIAGAQTLISQAHNAGLKFLCSTLTPFQGAGYWTQAGENAREQYDTFIRGSGSGCDGVIDQDVATHDPNNPTMFLPAYDSGDHLHPNDAGYQAIANSVNLGFFGTVAEGPFGGTPAPVPGTVQAENYDTGGQGVAYNVSSINGNGTAYRTDGVDLETTSDTGGGDDLGWTSTGQWFRYTVNVSTAGSYVVTLRVAAPNAVTDAFHIANAAGANLSGAVNLPATGGWQTWTSVTATVTLPAGQQVLTLDEDNGGWNVNYLSFSTTANPPPPPFGLTAMSGNSQVSLAWTTDSGATTYNVYRGATSGGEGATPITTGLTATSYVNTGLTNGTTYYYKVAGVNAAGTSGFSGEASATPTGGSPTGIAIACGNSAVGSFLADTDFSGGAVSSGTTSSINLSKVTNPAPMAVYQHGRKSTCTYTIGSLTQGNTYNVRLDFCEYAVTGSGQRTFNVSINGNQVLTNYDIFANAGGEFIANAQSFTATANSSGQIVIIFTTVLNNALVAGIEVSPSTGGGLTPVAQIDAGSPSAVSPFSADTDFNTGNEFSSTAAINTSGESNPAPAAVYQTVRWNTAFTYTIPNLTANASYTVRLHFCELTWTAAGQRKFNVAINGTTVLSALDVFATAGAQNKAVTEQFTTTANSSGQIAIAFTQGGADNPAVAGIEVLH